jgi:exopolyphosphatase/guanosine-5'-triphosphate,3'-diphosphate pyrophosphatase
VTPPAGRQDSHARRAAVIDVGSNSTLLLAVEVDAAGRARALEEALVTTRLGSGLQRGGVLAADARQRTREAVVELAARGRRAGAETVWGFATGAVREAADGVEFARLLADAAGIEVEILSGEAEARLAYDAVAAAFPGDRPSSRSTSAGEARN